MSQNKAFSAILSWLFFVFTSAISCTALVLLRLPKTRHLWQKSFPLTTRALPI